jgi:hypothetical protein
VDTVGFSVSQFWHFFILGFPRLWIDPQAAGTQVLLSWRIGLLFPYAAIARNGLRAANSARRFAIISALTVLLAS